MDLQWTQAQWTAFFEKLGIPISAWYAASRIKETIGSAKITINKFLDGENLTNWELAGIVLGSNTDVDGKLYITCTPINGSLDIDIYKDAAKAPANLVASGTAALPPCSAALVEANSSGISGSVWVKAQVADSDIFLVCTPGILNQFDVLPSEDVIDSDYKADAASYFARMYRNADSLQNRIESFARNHMIDFIRGKIGSTESQTGGWRESQEEGDVSYEAYGVLGDLIDAMLDETLSGIQTVERAAMYAIGEDTFSEDGDNTGVVYGNAPSVFSLWEHVLAGRYTLRCVSADRGTEEFEVAVVTPQGVKRTAPYRLRVNKTFRSIDLGIHALLFRWAADTLGGVEFAKFTAWDFQGLTERHCDGDVIYLKYTASSQLLELFSTDTRDDDHKIAEGTVSGGSCDFTEYNNSGLSGSVQVTGTPGDDSAMYVDIHFFALDDKIYFEVSKVGESYFNEFFGRLFKVNIPSQAAAHKIDDGIAFRGFSGLTGSSFVIDLD